MSAVKKFIAYFLHAVIDFVGAVGVFNGAVIQRQRHSVEGDDLAIPDREAVIREEVGASEWEAGDCDVAVLGDEISEQISVLFSCIESVVSAVPETALSKAS